MCQPRPPWQLAIQPRALSAALHVDHRGRVRDGWSRWASLGCVVVAGSWAEMKAPGRTGGSEAACCLSNRGRSGPGLQLGRVWSPVEPGHAKDTNPSFFSKPFQIDRRDGVAAIAPFPSFLCFQFSRSVVSDSLQPRSLQDARLPCPSPTPGAWSNSGPSS